MSDEYIYIDHTKVEDEEWCVVKLHGNLTNVIIDELTGKMIEIINNNDNIHLQIESVEGIDLTFIQLLHSMKKTVDVFSKKIKFEINLHEGIKSIIADAGFNSKLNT